MAEVKEVKDEVIGFRIFPEDLNLIEKMVEYRFTQGQLPKKTLSEYLRYCVNRDIAEALAQITKKRR